MREIPLSHGKVAVIDDDDYARVSRFKWRAVRFRRGPWYAARNNLGKLVLMHRVVVDAPDDKQVDHRNGDGLDNRRKNLRLASHAENQRNGHKYQTNTSGFKGVVRHGRKWQAQIGVDRKRLYLGDFERIEDAACPYDEAARKYHGEFAKLNFPESSSSGMENA